MKYKLLWNRIAGYCIPNNVREYSTSVDANLNQHALNSRSSLASLKDKQQDVLAETGMKVISAIQCYCDIQFSRKEFLTVLNQLRHPFTKQFEQLVQTVETI